jgi:hypothetical protein
MLKINGADNEGSERRSSGGGDWWCNSFCQHSTPPRGGAAWEMGRTHVNNSENSILICENYGAARNDELESHRRGAERRKVIATMGSAKDQPAGVQRFLSNRWFLAQFNQGMESMAGAFVSE